MTMKINIPLVLQPYTEETEQFETDCGTVGECFKELMERYPETQKWFAFKDGNLLTDKDIFVLLNEEGVYPVKLNTPIKDGDEISMGFIISGG